MQRNIFLWVIIVSLLFMIFSSFDFKTKVHSVDYSEFIRQVNNGEVSQITVDGYRISGIYQDGSSFETIRPAIVDNRLMDDLFKNKVRVIGTQRQEPSLWRQLLVASFPLLLLFALFLFFMRSAGNGLGGRGGNNPFNFGKSKAKLIAEDKINTTFKDVAGVDEAKEEIADLVEFLRNPAKFHKIGGRIPKGVVMAGPPGTGKTLLAKAIAGEAKVPFFFISGSDFVEMFVGVGASRVRDMFEKARKNAPCIIFIDEIDAVGRHRGAGIGGGHDEREQTLNQLLVEMDGFDSEEGVIVIAATNRVDILDPALLRPGRFDRRVHIGLPDIKGREDILHIHSRKVPLAKDADLSVIARGTPGMSGADLENIINEAALLAAKDSVRTVMMRHLEEAKDKTLMGPERRSMVLSDEEKLNTANHESGHAILGRLLPAHDPVYKVTILPRGGALGVTMFLPEKDKYSMTKEAILSMICSLFGGRIAEEITLGVDHITTGAQNDIERATQLARNMVMKWGLSDLGPLDYSSDDGEVFLGRSAGQNQYQYSQETRQKIDLEVKRIVDECYKRSYSLITDNMDKLHAMAAALMQYETIDSAQIDAIMAGNTPGEPHAWQADTSASAQGDDVESADDAPKAKPKKSRKRSMTTRPTDQVTE